MGGTPRDTHRIPNSTNREIVCCQNGTPQTPCDPRGSLCNQHTHLCYTKMTCGLVSSQTNSLEQTVYLNQCRILWSSVGKSPTQFPRESKLNATVSLKTCGGEEQNALEACKTRITSCDVLRAYVVDRVNDTCL